MKTQNNLVEIDHSVHHVDEQDPYTRALGLQRKHQKTFEKLKITSCIITKHDASVCVEYHSENVIF